MCVSDSNVKPFWNPRLTPVAEGFLRLFKRLSDLQKGLTLEADRGQVTSLFTSLEALFGLRFERSEASNFRQAQDIVRRL
jgi:hypothetical protein